jgi:hypothetical protein
VLVISLLGCGGDGGESLETERARATLYAQQAATQCTKGGCVVLELERVAPRLWRVRERHPDGQIICIAIDLEHFRVASNGETIHGASEVPCATP